MTKSLPLDVKREEKSKIRQVFETIKIVLNEISATVIDLISLFSETRISTSVAI